MPHSENADEKQKPHLFQKGQSGNPAGKPRGTRHRATQAAIALAEGQLTEIVQSLLNAALEGDTGAAKIILDKLIPNRRESPLPEILLPQVTTAADLPVLTAAILAQVVQGSITPGEGQALSALAANHAKAIEVQELEARIKTLEEKQNDKKY